jgi:PhnB protein
MATKAKAIPDDYPVITPALVCRNAPAVIDFCKKVFGARERMRMPGPNGSVMHAELEIGDKGLIMLGDESPQVKSRAPQPDGSSPVPIHVYVDDVDKAADRAKAAGAKELIPVADMFYGDRSGRFMDPTGHVWIISTHREDVPEEELQKRMKGMGAAG